MNLFIVASLKYGNARKIFWPHLSLSYFAQDKTIRHISSTSSNLKSEYIGSVNTHKLLSLKFHIHLQYASWILYPLNQSAIGSIFQESYSSSIYMHSPFSIATGFSCWCTISDNHFSRNVPWVIKNY